MSHCTFSTTVIKINLKSHSYVSFHYVYLLLDNAHLISVHTIVLFKMIKDFQVM
jgi:hypothetical protein